MRFLFFLVHPAKFHFHKHQIHGLKERGHEVDVIITKKDILEELVRNEGFEYQNIFPEGRKIPGLHVYLAAGISLIRTVFRLLRYTWGKKYDLFIGDLLTIVGRLKRVPSLYPTDDVLRQVPEQAVFLSTCDHIVAPAITDLERFNRKKIPYRGIKALAHLHPSLFTPDPTRLLDELKGQPYFIIRCVGFTATHDIAKEGIGDDILEGLVERLAPHGQILISSERTLPERFRKYQKSFNKNDISHFMAHAELLIADSTTMCSEAAVLGTYAIEYDNYFHEIEQMIELDEEYGLIKCIQPPDRDALFGAVDRFFDDPAVKGGLHQRRARYLEECEDVNQFLIELFEAYPEMGARFRPPALVHQIPGSATDG